MSSKKYLKEYDLEEVFNYDQYLKFMNSKVVKNPRTWTPLDFITEDQEKKLREENINDLSIYDPTPKEIQKHIDFAQKVYFELNDKLPNNEFIKYLGENEEGIILMVSTNWYEKYGYKY